MSSSTSDTTAVRSDGWSSPYTRMRFLAFGIGFGGLVLGGILFTLGVVKVGAWSLTFNVGLMLLMFGYAGLRIASLAKESRRPV